MSPGGEIGGRNAGEEPASLALFNHQGKPGAGASPACRIKRTRRMQNALGRLPTQYEKRQRRRESHESRRAKARPTATG